MRTLVIAGGALALASVAACIPKGYSWGNNGAGGNGAGGTAAPAPAPADTPPPSLDLAITGAAKDLSQLTSTAAGESSPAVSPDGKTILFTAWSNQITDGQDTGNLAEETIDGVHPDGRGLSVYSSRRAFGADAAWLGDHAFAYVSNAMGEFQIVRAARLTANAATTVIVRADAAPQAGGLSSSRDGKLIAFHAKIGDQFMVMSVHPDGTELTTVAQGSFPRVSADGQRIAFEREVGETWRIFVTAADGGEETQITDGEMDCEMPSWAPDASWLVISCNGGWDRFEGADKTYVRNLFLVRPDGTGLTQLTEGARQNEHTDWSSDGTIYFSSTQSGNADLWRLRPVFAAPATGAR